MKWTFRIFALLLVLCLQGCVATFLEATNRTGEPITVTSGHTNKSYDIAPNKTKSIPHTSGDLMIETKSGEKWVLPNVISTQGGEWKSHFIFWNKVIKRISIEKQNLRNQPAAGEAENTGAAVKEPGR